MSPPKSRKKTTDFDTSVEPLCAAQDPRTHYRCTRPLRPEEPHDLHVCVISNEVVAAWSADPTPSLALNLAKVRLLNEVTNLVKPLITILTEFAAAFAEERIRKQRAQDGNTRPVRDK